LLLIDENGSTKLSRDRKDALAARLAQEIARRLPPSG